MESSHGCVACFGAQKERERKGSKTVTKPAHTLVLFKQRCRSRDHNPNPLAPRQSEAPKWSGGPSSEYRRKSGGRAASTKKRAKTLKVIKKKKKKGQDDKKDDDDSDDGAAGGGKRRMYCNRKQACCESEHMNYMITEQRG